MLHDGTKRLQAPEVLLGKYGCEIDIWSLGCFAVEITCPPISICVRARLALPQSCGPHSFTHSLDRPHSSDKALQHRHYCGTTRPSHRHRC